MKRLNPVRLIAVLLLAGCGREPAPPTVAPSGSASPAPRPSAPTSICADGASVRAHFGQVCAITGKYAIKTFPGKGGGTLGDWPVVVLDDGSEVMIESLWDASKKPDPATVQRLQGKRVEVVGELRSSPPRELPANFGFPCISPVHDQRVVPDSPAAPD